jgi:hypothetical protein
MRNQITNFRNSADLRRQHRAGVGERGVLLASRRVRAGRTRGRDYGLVVRCALGTRNERRGSPGLSFDRRRFLRGRLSASDNIGDGGWRRDITGRPSLAKRDEHGE